MPKNDIPSRAQLQKEYKQLENFALDPKLHSTLSAAAQNKATAEKLKANPAKFLGDKRFKIPVDVKISVSITRFRICIWVCRVIFRRYIVCVRYCFPIIIVH
ncbi:MAG TPA: hypothetical protein VJU78_20465 [Chitinophagaceae bacterium]|nr:hypothetical protein [Chitinophagaceae bacterium]